MKGNRQSKNVEDRRGANQTGVNERPESTASKVSRARSRLERTIPKNGDLEKQAQGSIQKVIDDRNRVAYQADPRYSKQPLEKVSEPKGLKEQNRAYQDLKEHFPESLGRNMIKGRSNGVKPSKFKKVKK